MSEPTNNMKTLLRIEQFALFALSIFLFAQLEFAWWWFAVLFLTPDLSMLGYLGGPKVGAWTYNFVHLKASAVVVYLAGGFFGLEALQLAGLVMLGHSSFDRVMGYGLKYPDAFNNTHLGKIGKEA